MQGWNETFLSQAGKEVLLKAVIQAIPTYIMSVFLLPKSLCKDINSLMSKFFWGQKQKDSCIAWMSWSKMGKAKDNSGLGFRDFGVVQLSSSSKTRLEVDPKSRRVSFQNSEREVLSFDLFS